MTLTNATGADAAVQKDPTTKRWPCYKCARCVHDDQREKGFSKRENLKRHL